MTTILTVGEERAAYVLNLSAFDRLQFIYYPILKSREAFLQRDVGLMHSFAASYGVYLMHAIEHLSKQDDNDLFLLNPRLDLMPLEWLELCKTLEVLRSADPIILVAANNVLLGIYLPKRHVKNAASLRFMTFSNLGIDVQLLMNEWKNAHTQILSIQPSKYVADDFLIRTDSLICELQAIHYLRANSPEIVGILPYHAGDVLFCSLAIKDTKSQIQIIAVNACYEEIAKKVLAPSQIMSLAGDPPKRGDNQYGDACKHLNDEVLYFYYEIYPKLAPTTAFYYMRNWRYYDDSDFHYIDQCRYAAVIEKRPLVHQSQNEAAEESLTNEKSVLLHFDAGWDLKIYPKTYQEELVRKLKEENFFVTILTNKEPVLGSDAVVQFENLNQLERLAKKHSLFVGMDSFPAHYATHCLQHPTITLFSSTKRCNSDQASSHRYKSLEQGLGCNPCRRSDQCPLTKLNSCSNFSRPEVVLAEINKMYKHIR